MKYEREIKKLEKKLASLQAKATKSAAKNKKTAIQKVTSLVKKLGYASIQHLLQNVDDAIAAVPERIRKRAKITDAIRKSVIVALKAGKTGAEVAKAHRVSTASVNIIKAKAGLTKSRKAAKLKAPKKVAKQVRRMKPGVGKESKVLKSAAKIEIAPTEEPAAV